MLSNGDAHIVAEQSSCFRKFFILKFRNMGVKRLKLCSFSEEFHMTIVFINYELIHFPCTLLMITIYEITNVDSPCLRSLFFLQPYIRFVCCASTLLRAWYGFLPFNGYRARIVGLPFLVKALKG